MLWKVDWSVFLIRLLRCCFCFWWIVELRVFCCLEFMLIFCRISKNKIFSLLFFFWRISLLILLVVSLCFCLCDEWMKLRFVFVLVRRRCCFVLWLFLCLVSGWRLICIRSIWSRRLVRLNSFVCLVWMVKNKCVFLSCICNWVFCNKSVLWFVWLVWFIFLIFSVFSKRFWFLIGVFTSSMLVVWC